jgi:hypothetical protein
MIATQTFGRSRNFSKRTFTSGGTKGQFRPGHDGREGSIIIQEQIEGLRSVDSILDDFPVPEKVFHFLSPP